MRTAPGELGVVSFLGVRMVGKGRAGEKSLRNEGTRRLGPRGLSLGGCEWENSNGKIGQTSWLRCGEGWSDLCGVVGMGRQLDRPLEELLLIEAAFGSDHWGVLFSFRNSWREDGSGLDATQQHEISL